MRRVRSPIGTAKFEAAKGKQAMELELVDAVQSQLLYCPSCGGKIGRSVTLRESVTRDAIGGKTAVTGATVTLVCGACGAAHTTANWQRFLTEPDSVPSGSGP